MPRPPKRPLSEQEVAEMNAQYDTYKAEALIEPMAYVPHDTNAHMDDAMRMLVASCDNPYEGLARAYEFWCLMELLAARKNHYYDVSTERGWKFLSIDMSTCGTVVSVTECKELVESLVDLDLLARDIYWDTHHVMSERICRNAEKYAQSIADKKIGAWRTNRARAMAEQTHSDTLSANATDNDMRTR